MGYYIYLISSLPMLSMGTKPPVDPGKFLSMCRGLISDAELDILGGIFSLPIYEYKGSQHILNKYAEFERTLRNELVKIRAARRKVEPDKYLREGSWVKPEIAHAALAAYRNPSLVEGELILERQRWDYLEELSMGHYFDLDFLVIYACKLVILSRWDKINAADKTKVLEDLLRKDYERA